MNHLHDQDDVNDDDIYYVMLKCLSVFSDNFILRIFVFRFYFLGKFFSELFGNFWEFGLELKAFFVGGGGNFPPTYFWERL